MFSVVCSGGIRGIGGYMVQVETDISPGMPMFELVGYLGSEVKEAGQRVRTALNNTGYSIPIARITVNLSPADIRKNGTGYDLPIALSVLCCMGVVNCNCLEKLFVVGELRLSGQLAPTRGILPMLLEAKKCGMKKCIIPSANQSEGMMVDGIDVIGVDDISEMVSYLNGDINIMPYRSNVLSELSKPKEYEYDFKNIKGQVLARRGIEVGAAGLHNVIMTGPPGAGKSMLAKCIPSILPDLTMEECMEISSIYSVKGVLTDEKSIITKRPFISTHHTSTDISLIGGGLVPRPGAVSMAHNGVLFMDELPEYSRRTLEALRQPMEDRVVSIARNRDVCTFPSNFMLIAAMNPCPCGYYPDISKCTCTQSQRQRYAARISGPLLDRIDICISVDKISPRNLLDDSKSESSDSIRARIINAHNIQIDRFKGRQISFNSQMNNSDIAKYCALGKSEKKMMDTLIQKYDMSARSYFRVMKVARTIADLTGRDNISETDIAEAVRFKM